MNTTANQSAAMLKCASDTMHELVDHISDLQDENNSLRVELEAVKQANAGKVTLQKVASAQPDKVDELVTNLINHCLLPESEREKCATALLENPNNILDIANQALKASELPLETGYGTKQASSQEDTTSDSNAVWMKTLASYESNY